jgi:hypothetical protein
MCISVTVYNTRNFLIFCIIINYYFSYCNGIWATKHCILVSHGMGLDGTWEFGSPYAHNFTYSSIVLGHSCNRNHFLCSPLRYRSFHHSPFVTHPAKNVVWCKEFSVTNNIVQCLGSFCTETWRVSGYPWQVLKVETLLRQLRFIWTALPTVITLNNCTTRHL